MHLALLRVYYCSFAVDLLTLRRDDNFVLADLCQKILAGAGYYDVGGKLDEANVKEQLGWFKAQGLVKGEIDPDALFDTRFLPVL